MGIGKVSSLAVASLAKVNTLAKASINKIVSVTASFAAAFTDNNAVSKSLTTGSGQAIFIEETTAYSFTQSSAFTVGVWIKAGWTNNLNTNLQFFATVAAESTSVHDEQIRIFYNESNNRLEFRIGSAAYWSGNKLGNAFYSSGNNSGSANMSTNARRVTLGSAAHHYQKSGDTTETKYNVLTIFDKQLSDSEVATLYNSGTPVSPTVAKSIGNLVGYYNFESDGSDTSGNGNETFAINGDSNIEAK